MNERIRQLAKEAGYYLYDLTETHGIKTVETDSTNEWITLEKFAELIVRECATAIEKDLCNRPDDHVSNYFDGGLRHSIRSIKQHFGVEE